MKETEVDKNIRRLMIALNSLPKVIITSCCGGHKNPKQGEVEEGDFYIYFMLEPVHISWWVLKIIACAVTSASEKLEGQAFFNLQVWAEEIPANLPVFEIHGWSVGGDTADPDLLAAGLEEHTRLMFDHKLIEDLSKQ